MHITELRIRNFRNFKKARFSFQKGVNTLIGENGSGKTNALFALRLLLDETLSRNATRLRDTDFCRALGEWKGHWIVISADFAELDSSEGCQLLKHSAGHMNSSAEGSFTLYFRPKIGVRSHLHQLSLEGDTAGISAYLGSRTIDDYEPITTGRPTADLLDDGEYADLVGDFSTYTFPNPDDDDQNRLGVRIGAIHSEVTCTFAQALRDVVADLRGYRSNPLLALLRGMESEIEIADVDRITQTVAGLNKDISGLPEIKEIASGIQNTLHATIGHTYSPGVSIESALPSEIEKLLQRLTVTVGDDERSAHRGDLADQSLGGANLIYIALKLLEYELKLRTDKAAHFLLIEEPEAHIHTHIQKTLFENQPTKRTQVFLSTHSTQISSAARIRSMNVLARRADHAEVFQPSAGLSEQVAARIERYLDAVRTPLLFAKGVILVEGDAELVMLPALVRAVFGLSPDEMGISILSMDSAFFENVARVFHPKRIRRRCAILTDLDAAFDELPPDPSDDVETEAHARASQAAGLARHERLESFTRDNPWVKAFYAKHTFEVDFLYAGNSLAVAKTLPNVYKNQSSQKTMKNQIESDDLAKSARAVLKLASKVQKGWFALLLAEQVEAHTYVPEYMLRALAFAADGLPAAALKRAGLYRLNKNPLGLAKPFPPTTKLEKYDPEEFLAAYQSLAPDDAISKFLTYQSEHVSVEAPNKRTAGGS